MTLIFSLSNSSVTVSDFTLKALVRTFLIHCDFHNIGANEYTFSKLKASHDEERGAWKEKSENRVWIDPEEGFDAIYEVLKNV